MSAMIVRKDSEFLDCSRRYEKNKYFNCQSCDMTFFHQYEHYITQLELVEITFVTFVKYLFKNMDTWQDT